MLTQLHWLLYTEFLEAGCAVFSMVMVLLRWSILVDSWLECAFFEFLSVVDDAVVCLSLASVLSILVEFVEYVYV